MKILRLLRNLAALFILGAALLALRPAPVAANNSKFCFLKLGYNGCTFDKNGNCSDTKCEPGQPCLDSGCVKCKRPCFL